MPDTYRYRKSSRVTVLFLLPLLLLIFALLYRTLFPEEIMDAGPAYMAAGFLFVVFYLYCLMQLVREYTTQISLDPLSIRIKDFLSSKKYKWHEITEYGMDDMGYGQFKKRNLYIKTTITGDSKIRIADKAIENVNDMSKKLVARSVNSRVVRTENVSSIPFAKDYLTSSWDGTV